MRQDLETRFALCPVVKILLVCHPTRGLYVTVQ